MVLSTHSILRIPMLLAIFVSVPERSLQRFLIPRRQITMFLLAFLTAKPQRKGVPPAALKSITALIETIVRMTSLKISLTLTLRTCLSSSKN